MKREQNDDVIMDVPYYFGQTRSGSRIPLPVIPILLGLLIIFSLTSGCTSTSALPGLPFSLPGPGLSTNQEEEEDIVYHPPPIPEETVVPEPEPTSYVSTLPDTLPADYFIPHRSSLYFQDTAQDEDNLYLIYSEKDIPLNNTIKEKKISVEKSPLSVIFSVHPEQTPLLSWARLTVRDRYGTVIEEDGYNRKFSSEEEKEIKIYRTGVFLLEIEGDFGMMDLDIHTGDEKAEQVTAVPTQDRNIPPEILMRLENGGY